jgi:5'-3' exonuclease
MAFSLTDLSGKTALVDGDIVVYRCAAAAEKTHYLVTYAGEEVKALYDNHKDAKAAATELGDGVIWSRKEVQPVENALQIAKTCLNNTLELLKTNEYKVYLTGKRNFRDTVAVTHPYKDRRPERPKWYRDVREYLVAHWGATVSDGIEADDAIGIEATRLGPECVIVSNDKDLSQIVGWHFDWTSHLVRRVGPKEAAHNLYRQILSGDATDTVVGIPGIGPAKAGKLLDGARDVRDLFERSWAAYRSHFGESLDGPDIWNYFLEQAQLVYILRREGEFYKPPYIPEEVK